MNHVTRSCSKIIYVRCFRYRTPIHILPSFHHYCSVFATGVETYLPPQKKNCEVCLEVEACQGTVEEQTPKATAQSTQAKNNASVRFGKEFTSETRCGRNLDAAIGFGTSNCKYLYLYIQYMICGHACGMTTTPLTCTQG